LGFKLFDLSSWSGFRFENPHCVNGGFSGWDFMDEFLGAIF
jgi:hypothetical protein